MQVVICGPNIRFRHGCTFEVHTAGCADLKRGQCRQDSHPLALDADSVLEVVEAMYSDQIAESDDDIDMYVHDFHFAPCCNALPYGDES